MLWPSTGKRKIHLGGYNLLEESLETHDQSNRKLRTSRGPVKTIETNPSLCKLQEQGISLANEMESVCVCMR